MPYGPGFVGCLRIRSGSFNPSYGLHALRALVRGRKRLPRKNSFNPSYGLHALRAGSLAKSISPTCSFQSLIWVACPTGVQCWRWTAQAVRFQSLIWVACPTGATIRVMSPAWAAFQSLIWVACPTGRCVRPAWCAGRSVSIPHMGCMPYGRMPEPY